MKFALIVDSCKVESYIVRNKKAYKFKEPNVPYQFHHSINNECFMGFWSYPFVFNGCFLNWSEWKELPDLDLDIIFVSIEKKFEECEIQYLRKKYSHAKIFGYVKEMWNLDFTWQKRLKVLNQCDHVIFPIMNYNMFPNIVNNCIVPISFLPQPVDIDYLYDNFYHEERNESLFVYDITFNQSRQGDTIKFANHISKKYNIPINHINTQNEKDQWYKFVSYWPKSTFHINLDPIRSCMGQQTVQCATLGVIQLGGLNDSHEILFPETATNDFDVLESKFLDYLNNHENRIKTMKYAFDMVNQIYSYDSTLKQFSKIKGI